MSEQFDKHCERNAGACEWPHCECKRDTFPEEARPAMQPAKERIQGYLDSLDSYGSDSANCYWTPTTEAFKELCDLALKGLTITRPEALSAKDHVSVRRQLLEDARHFLLVGSNYAPDKDVCDQNKATLEMLKIKGLRSVMLEVAELIEETLTPSPQGSAK